MVANERRGNFLEAPQAARSTAALLVLLALLVGRLLQSSLGDLLLCTLQLLVRSTVRNCYE